MPGPDVKSNYDAVLDELKNGGGTSRTVMTSPKMSQDVVQDIVSIMQADANKRLVDFFTGAKLQYGHDMLSSYAGYVSSSLEEKLTIQGNSTTRGIEQGISIGRQIKAIVDSIMDAVSSSAVKQAASAGADSGLMGQVKGAATKLAIEAFGPKFVATAAPVIGLIPSAYSALTANASAIQGITKSVYASRYVEVVKVGAPRGAADAVNLILTRKAAYLSTHAVTANLNLGASIATVATTGAFAVGEMAIKIATAVVDLIAEISMVCIELYEHVVGERLLEAMDVPNEALADQKLFDTLFLSIYNGCPLLGAYMLSAAPYFNTSDFVTLTSSPGQLASVDEIGRIAIENVNPLRLYGSQIIKDSKLKLTHRDPKYAAVMREAEMLAKAKEEQSLLGQTKRKLKKFGSSIKRRMGLSKPRAPDPAWKANIQGFGSD